MRIDRDALDQAISRLDQVDLSRLELVDALTRVVDATQALFNVTGSGLMFVDAASVLRFVVATDEPGRVLEAGQEQTGEGPCVDAWVHGTTVATADIATDDRWPRVRDVVAPAGVRAVLGIPVAIAGTPVGSLNVYCDEPHEWDESETDAIRAFNTIIENVAATALLVQRRGEVIEQLQYALDNRVVIERAVGVVMGREEIDAVTAFQRLRGVARSRRIRVAEVAQEVLDRGRLDS